jgi:magnesium-transporting ATPase (P-type)
MVKIIAVICIILVGSLLACLIAVKANKFALKKARSKERGGIEVDFDIKRHANNKRYFPEKELRGLLADAEDCGLSASEITQVRSALSRRTSIFDNFFVMLLTTLLPAMFFYAALAGRGGRDETVLFIIFIISAMIPLGFLTWIIIALLRLKQKQRLLDSGRYKSYIVEVRERFWSLQKINNRGAVSYFEHYYVRVGDIVLKVDEKTYTAINGKAVIAVFELNKGTAVEVFAAPVLTASR